MKIFAHLLILISLLCVFVGSYYLWLRMDPNRLTFQSYPYATEVVTGQLLPERVTLPDLRIDAPVFPAEVKGNMWETTNDGASYLLSSPIPGEIGNSIIYAHNWASLFGNLRNAKPGQKVNIEFADRSTKTFLIISTATVTPSDFSILAPSHDRRITLYTCDGWFDTKRFVVVAILLK
jgi:LPXTG-site transpeptidase (sortase) family protein